ncbi:hypothetical protein J437_LFUL016964 [Ladona fulva]|uniref:Uncharacterized protein n=1 Tax=Ladona fulva TaxID=123851 RepID=A0A8K0P7W8_LADFU|nr:hypothetical protein J437_LFUL016964 [Ladona fulva]
MLHYFISKERAAETHRLLVDIAHSVQNAKKMVTAISYLNNRKLFEGTDFRELHKEDPCLSLEELTTE